MEKPSQLLFIGAAPGEEEFLSAEKEYGLIDNEVFAAAEGWLRMHRRSSPAMTLKVLTEVFSDHSELNPLPNYVHIAAHGQTESANYRRWRSSWDQWYLVLEDRKLELARLIEIFKPAKKTLQFVVINSCYAEHAGAKIADQLGVEVAFAHGKLWDACASQFATEFYHGIAARKPFLTAFSSATRGLEQKWGYVPKPVRSEVA